MNRSRSAPWPLNRIGGISQRSCPGTCSRRGIAHRDLSLWELDELGWLNGLRMPETATRRQRKPVAHQPALFA